jgi:hypothetical protein
MWWPYVLALAVVAYCAGGLTVIVIGSRVAADVEAISASVDHL